MFASCGVRRGGGGIIGCAAGNMMALVANRRSSELQQVGNGNVGPSRGW